jgi:2-polyprenyl-3-methyl-5-hydroxy-6-metoxy-1,4-benzoquinol methylase
MLVVAMKNILDKQVQAYDTRNLYEFDNKIMLNWYPHRVIKFSRGAKSILELGLGHGYSTNIFAKHFSHHVVLDGSPAVINRFRTIFPDCPAQIVETYFEHFTSDKKFDVIVLGFILEHVNDPQDILARYRTFLAPNGRMFAAVPNAESLNRRLGNLAGLLPDMQLLSETDIALGHRRYYTVATLKEEVGNAGYSIKRIEGLYLKPFTTNQMISLNFDTNIIDALCHLGVEYPELSCGILAQLKVK